MRGALMAFFIFGFVPGVGVGWIWRGAQPSAPRERWTSGSDAWRDAPATRGVQREP